MPQVTIRDMRDEDCPEVSRVVCESFRWGARREGWAAEAVADYVVRRGREDAIREQSRGDRFLVACSGATITGVVATRGNEISKLYVDPSLLRRGIGSALFRAAEEAIRRDGHRDLVLGTVFDASIPFYEAMGMSKAGRKSVVCGPAEGAEAIIMKKPVPGQEKAEPDGSSDTGRPGAEPGG